MYFSDSGIPDYQFFLEYLKRKSELKLRAWTVNFGGTSWLGPSSDLPLTLYKEFYILRFEKL